MLLDQGWVLCCWQQHKYLASYKIRQKYIVTRAPTDMCIKDKPPQKTLTYL